MKKFPVFAALFIFLLISGLGASHSLDRFPTDVTILTQNDFIGRPFYSVADALQGLPSLNIEQDGYRGTAAVAKIRGLSSSKYVLVLLDGEPLTHEYDGEVDLGQIPLNMVERIEISRGGGSMSLGSGGTAGIINIITSRPSKKGLLSRIGTGVGRDGVKHSYGQLKGRSRLGDVTYAGGREESGGFMTNEDYSATNHFINFTRSFNGKGYWGAEYYFQESDVGMGHGTLVPLSEWNGKLEHFSADPLGLKTQEFQHAKIFLASPQIKGGHFYLTLTRSDRSLDLFAQEGGPALRDQDSRSFEADLKWKTKSVETGVQTRSLRREIFPMPRDETTQKEFYGSKKWSGEKWTALPGVRYDADSQAGGKIDPRLALIYAPSSSWALTTTAQTAHRVPTFDDFFFSSTTINNPNLHSEKSVSADAGVAWSPTSQLKLQLTGFFIRIDDLIQPDSTNRLTNDGVEKVDGLETELTIRTGESTRWRDFTISGNWTVQNSRQDTSSTSGFVDSPLTPAKLGLFKVDYHLSRSITFSNELRYQSEQFELPNKQGLRVPSYSVWNARFGFKILAADIFIEGHNLTRRRYADTVSRFTPPGGPAVALLSPQPERTFWTGITIQFEN